MKSYNTILFDLDGTLTNPKIGIVNAIKYVMKNLGKNQEDAEKIIDYIGLPLKEIFKNVFNLCNEEIDNGVKIFREYYSAQGMFENEVYPGIERLLSDLFKLNKKLIVATLKPTVYAVEILKNFKLDEYFYFISGVDLEACEIDKSRVIMKSLEELGDELVKEIVMIGDRNCDIIGAKNNNIDSIGVLYGYGTEVELKAEQPNFLVRSIEELDKVLKNY